MYEEISRRLYNAQQGVFYLHKIDKVLEELRKNKLAFRNKVEELNKILKKEDIDVEKLEGVSLAHMLHIILGDLQEKVQKERQEAVAAKLKYDQAIQDLNHIEAEITKWEAERMKYEGIVEEYHELYEKKKNYLMKSNTVTAHKIMDISEKISSFSNMIKEVQEAISAGENVLNHLKSASESLNSAEGWGTWDLLGGGLLSDMMKHSHIDDAKSEVERVQMALLRFRTELADIQIDNNISIETDGFARFADFFFDGLIADWCMQSRIHESQESVDNVRNQVCTVIRKLEDMERECNSNKERLNIEIEKLVEMA